MSTLLRLSALSCALWAVCLLVFKDQVIAVDQLTPVARGLANGLGISQLILVYFFLSAARAPAENRVAIQAAIALMAIRTANDLYEIIILLPPMEALGSVLDLMMSVALLVGLLEALPRTFRPASKAE
jgi:hypothetical protein